MDKADKALQKVSQLLTERETQLWQNRPDQVRQMPGASLKFRRIANAPDREQLYDYLAEIRYALVFAGIGFQVHLEPLGEEGPDLGISRDGHSAVVEVKRFRQVDQCPPKISLSDKEVLDDTFILEPYGDPERDIKKVISRIAEKFKQVGNRESIIAVWNDDEKDIESEHALSELRNDATQQRLSLPNGLLFVLYGSDWQRPRQQFYCFPLRILGIPHTNWMQELESSFVYTLM